MKQVLIKKGKIVVEEVPSPSLGNCEVLVRALYSCISTGTEMSGLNESSKPLIIRLARQPENIIKGLQMLKEQGLQRTMAAVNGVLDAGHPIGYSASGEVIAVGKAIKDISVGDRVACAGVGIANHAEFMSVPRNLLVRVPDDLPLDVASTVTLGSIALQGVRRADPRIGEYIAVIGLGVLGQLTAQILKANGCKVIGIDIDERRISIAMSLGMDKGLNYTDSSVIEDVIRFTGGYGADSVIITASSKDNEIIDAAMDICRKKGRVIIVGDVGMDLKREKFYKKELDVLISTSYGPGRYDSRYEQNGEDYPYPYVRWTENRNMQAYLELLKDEKINIRPLIERVYKIEDAENAYRDLNTPAFKPLIALFRYNAESTYERKIVFSTPVRTKGSLRVGLIGAGGFAKGMHLPNLQKLDKLYTIHAIASKTGANASAIARQYNCSYATTDYLEILDDKDIDMVIIATRHNLHASIAIDAARAGKAVFLEKPMALNRSELEQLVKVLEETKVPFMVGFNRRFSPYSKKIKDIVRDRHNPMIINYRMNAGFIPKEHWVQSEEGGGRNIGEACHIYDLFTFFTESEVESIYATSVVPVTEQYLKNDNFIATIRFKDGSLCNLIYTALGSAEVPKEQMDIYMDGKILQMNDYKKLTVSGLKQKGIETRLPEKGQFEELLEFARAIKEGDGYPIPLWQMIQATEISFEIERRIFL